MSPRKAMADAVIYQLKITLRDAKPPIWRRVLVPSDITLAKLHKIIQAAMGWHDCHMHEFQVDGQIYGDPTPDMGVLGEINSDRTCCLHQFITGEKYEFPYMYDLGDGWAHQILVEKVLSLNLAGRYPICIQGRRACPPEDCGGVGGYSEFLKTIRDPQHPKHNEMLEWVGGDFDPEAFDLKATNDRLRQIQ